MLKPEAGHFYILTFALLLQLTIFFALKLSKIDRKNRFSIFFREKSGKKDRRIYSAIKDCLLNNLDIINALM